MDATKTGPRRREVRVLPEAGTVQIARDAPAVRFRAELVRAQIVLVRLGRAGTS